MEIEIKANSINERERQENDENENEENDGNENQNDNVNQENWRLSKKAFQENKISLSAKANVKFGLFCDLLDKCMKQKSKVKSQ